MNTNSELTEYMNGAIERLVTNALKSTLKNPKETAFILQFRSAIHIANKKRMEREEAGIHIPAFLISSITSRCNLFCKGCYARENKLCNESDSMPMLSEEKWLNIFQEASSLGIAFNLLAGGEPLLRKDVVLQAAKVKNMIFPIFTNGLMMNQDYLGLFSENRNLIPVISLEGSRELTDERRGSGTFDKLDHILKSLNTIKILYGCSITVTTENKKEVTSPEFIKTLADKGCRLIFFIEYVPVTKGTEYLALADDDRINLELQQADLRTQFKEMIFLSFPGDEKYLGGCLAAGRGFFHINPYGGAEPCPFSPYSDRNFMENSFLEVLQSPLFHKLNSAALFGREHMGGCALFEHEEEVKNIVKYEEVSP
jgi:MoaA/NifB/PqqE/SkfB family radical SAM enzyme